MGADHILFGSDYPHPEGLAEPCTYVDHLPQGSERAGGPRRSWAARSASSWASTRWSDQGAADMQLEHVIYEVVDAIAVITLNRPEAANAQSRKVLEELDRAWQAADVDPAVKVIVFKSNGKHFSAGPRHVEHRRPQRASRSSGTPTRYYDWETRHYLALRQVVARGAEAVDRRRAGQVHRRRAHAVLAVRSDRRRRQRAVLRSRARDGHLRRRAARAHLGVRAAQGQGAALHRRRDHGAAGRAARHGQPVVPLDELVPATMALAQRIARRMRSRCAWPSAR